MISRKNYYGYELVEEISKVLEISEGTLYPILRRLTDEKYFETYLQIFLRVQAVRLVFELFFVIPPLPFHSAWA